MTKNTPTESILVTKHPPLCEIDETLCPLLDTNYESLTDRQEFNNVRTARLSKMMDPMSH